MTIERKGDWIQTYTGLAFWPLDPRIEDFKLRDIAHALAHQCRWSGHCNTFFSVAEHSLHVAMLVPERLRKEALLHDASEAYLVDLPRPIKAMLPDYAVMEERINVALAERFGLQYPWPPEIKVADNKMLGVERDALLGTTPLPWHWEVPEMNMAEKRAVDLNCYEPNMAFQIYLAELIEIFGVTA